MTNDEDGEAVFHRVLTQVQEGLRSLYGPSGVLSWSESVFVRLERGAVVFVVVTPFEHDAVVNARCYVARELDRVDEALASYLVRLNSEQLFGAFSIDDDGDVCFDHSLLGTAVTEQALLLAVQVVAQAAEKYASEVIRRWGGVSSLDMLQRQLGEDEEVPREDREEPLN